MEQRQLVGVYGGLAVRTCAWSKIWNKDSWLVCIVWLCAHMRTELNERDTSDVPLKRKLILLITPRSLKYEYYFIACCVCIISIILNIHLALV